MCALVPSRGMGKCDEPDTCTSRVGTHLQVTTLPEIGDAAADSEGTLLWSPALRLVCPCPSLSATGWDGDGIDGVGVVGMGVVGMGMDKIIGLGNAIDHTGIGGLGTPGGEGINIARGLPNLPKMLDPKPELTSDLPNVPKMLDPKPELTSWSRECILEDFLSRARSDLRDARLEHVWQETALAALQKHGGHVEKALQVNQTPPTRMPILPMPILPMPILPISILPADLPHAQCSH